MAAQDPSAAEVMQRLIVEVTRLRKDVVRLLDRIKPYEDQFTAKATALQELDDIVLPIKSDADVRKALTRLKVEFGSTHYHLNAIRGRIDEIAADAILRDELKPWIVQAGPRKR